MSCISSYYSFWRLDSSSLKTVIRWKKYRYDFVILTDFVILIPILKEREKRKERNAPVIGRWTHLNT